MKFLKEHIIEVLISIVVALLGVIGKFEIDVLKNDLVELRCSVAIISVENNFQNAELELIGQTLDDLTVDSKQINMLVRLRDRFKPHLEMCGDGEELLKKIEALYKGLRAYITKDYDSAIQQFDLLDQGRSLTHQLLGSAKYRKALSLSGAETSKLEMQAYKHFDEARRLAPKEIGGEVKEIAILNLSCKPLLIKKTQQADREATDCLKNIVDKGHADHTTFYNLSALSSRMGRFDDALRYMYKCVEKGGNNYISRTDIDHDHDFHDHILKDSNYNSRFMQLLNKFKS